MNFRKTIKAGISMDDIHQITFLTQGNNIKKQELFDLLFDSDIKIAYRAAWIMTHFSLHENQWLYNKQNKLIDEAIVCMHSGKRRLILTLLYRQPLNSPPRVDFLDFCLEKMITQKEPPSVRALCMKIAYELCLLVPELLFEFKSILQMIGNDTPPSITSARKNILKAMEKHKSLQVY